RVRHTTVLACGPGRAVRRSLRRLVGSVQAAHVPSARAVGAAIHGPSNAAHAAPEGAAERSTQPAVGSAAQDLRVRRCGEGKYDCNRGTREKMIRLHGRSSLAAADYPRPSQGTTNRRGGFFPGAAQTRRVLTYS